MDTINSKLIAFGAVCLLCACGVQDQRTNETASNIEVRPESETTSTDLEIESPIGGIKTPESTDESQKFSDDLLAMKGMLSETYIAVEASDFAAAKTSFLKARQIWFNFGGGIKVKFADNYQTLDQGIKIINTNINQPKPAKDTLLTDLETITNELDLAFSEKL